MPTISRFYGIVVFMNYRDHPPPHFHARYQEYEITVEIESGITQGRMPARATQLIYEWAAQNEAALHDNRERARQGEPLQAVPPLV